MIFLVSKKKTDFDHKLKSLNKKITSNKTIHMLVENIIGVKSFY